MVLDEVNTAEEIYASLPIFKCGFVVSSFDVLNLVFEHICALWTTKYPM